MLLHNKPLKQRLPITAAIMTCIHSTVAQTPNDYHSIMIWVACSLGFFGFLIRCGEFTIPSESNFDPQAHLTVDDIAIDN